MTPSYKQELKTSKGKKHKNEDPLLGEDYVISVKTKVGKRKKNKNRKIVPKSEDLQKKVEDLGTENKQKVQKQLEDEILFQDQPFYQNTKGM